MCGIAGFVSSEPVSEARTIVRRMADAIAHRGPDDSGFYVDECAALGHRRLSIIDLAGGHQPMTNETGALQIVYNGEIFNHLQLRSRLESRGHHYRSLCDTETIIHAYEEWGSDCLKYFRGMFAFALWDSESKSLFCARDRLGKKPFYYFYDGKLFAFASEIKALLKHPRISAQFDLESLPEYLAFGYLSGDNTLFRGIRKLPPGHHLTVDLSTGKLKLKIQQYWDAPCPAASSTATSRELIAEMRRRLEETVQSRLMSDVPVGVFLSGGVDSSAIAALAGQFLGGSLQTFSVGYSELEFSELSDARTVANAIGARHHEVKVGMRQFFDALPHLVWHEDEPLAWPSSVPLYFVSKLAAEHVRVVLTGEGSDELFAGYERYRWQRLNVRAGRSYSRLPAALRSGLINAIATSRLIRPDLRRKLGHTFLAREFSTESLYLDNFYGAFSIGDQRLMGLSPSVEEVYGSYLRHFDKNREASTLARMLYADQKTYLVELLMKQDRMSMAASIESRVPLLDHGMVEFAASIPDSLKIHGRVQKYIFKKAVADLLPAETVHQRKRGFPTPFRTWLRGEASSGVYETVLNRSSFIGEILERKAVEQLIQRHRSNHEDATDRIWRLLNLELWAGLFISGAAKREPVEPPETVPAAKGTY